MFTLLEIGGILFWGLIAVEYLIVASLISHRHEGWATIALALSLLGIWVFSGFNPFAWIWAYPFVALYAALGYVALGAFWSMFKWYLYVYDVAHEYKKYREGGHDHDGALRRVREDMYKSSLVLPPAVSQHKSMIINWMAFWMFSVVGTFLGDFMYRMWLRIYNALANLMQSISNHTYRRIVGDI